MVRESGSQGRRARGRIRGFLFATGAGEGKRIFEDLHVSCRNAVAMGCPQLMSAPGPFTGSLKDAVGPSADGGRFVAEYGLKTLDRVQLPARQSQNSVETQRELVTAAGKPNVGLLLDRLSPRPQRAPRAQLRGCPRRGHPAFPVIPTSLRTR